MIVAYVLFPGLNPPLGGNSLAYYLFPVIIIGIPAAVVLVLVLCDQLERYAVPIKLMFVLAGAVLPAQSAFVFLNGALDRNPSVEAYGLVSKKSVQNGEDVSPYLVLSRIDWNQKQIELSFGVSREKFSLVKLGDSVRVAVHPGAFSRPWCGEVVVLNGHGAIRLN